MTAPESNPKHSLTYLILSLFIHAIIGSALIAVQKQRSHLHSAILAPVELVGLAASSVATKPHQATKPHSAAITARTKPLRSVPMPSKPQVPEPSQESSQSQSLESQTPGTQATTTETGSGVPTSSALQIYLSHVVQRIDEVKIYPEEAIFRGEEGQVIVSAHILPDGSIHHYHLAEPCPFESLNHAALDTIAQLGRLPPLPENIHRAITLRIPLRYELRRR